MSPRRTSIVLAVAAFAATACGPTVVDESIPSRDTAVPTTTTTFPPVDPDATTEELVDEIESLMFGLDQVIIDDLLAAEVVMVRIDDLWLAAERQIRRNDPDDVFNFEQAIELARIGTERNRPADASKGYKILADVSDAYFAPSA